MIIISPLPLQPSRRISNREVRPPLTRLSGTCFLARESSLGSLGTWVWGCGDSRAEAEVATGTVTQHKEGRQLRDWLKGNYRAMVEAFSGYSIFSCGVFFKSQFLYL